MQDFSQALQNPIYPSYIVVNGPDSFQKLLQAYGPEEMQAGLYNFEHTTTYNGFYTELNPPTAPVTDSQIINNFTQIIYYYNTSTCSY